MLEALLLALAVVANIAGMGWLALAMEPHWAQVHGTVSAPVRTIMWLRVRGAAGLAASLWLCLKVDHASMAALVWFMTLAGAALVIAFTLTWRARWLSALTVGLRRGS